jgi:hypothetical protein
VDGGILGPDTAPGDIVMGGTEEEGDTAVPRTVLVEDIDRHGPGQVVEDRKMADTIELSVTEATAKSQPGAL